MSTSTEASAKSLLACMGVTEITLILTRLVSLVLQEGPNASHDDLPNRESASFVLYFAIHNTACTRAVGPAPLKNPRFREAV
jgi:hypothetical protein